MAQKIHLFKLDIHNATMDETIALIDKTIQNKEHIRHVGINAGKLMAMKTDEQLFNDVVSADIVDADGQAIVWASKILGTPLKERVAGIDLMQNLIDLAAQKNYKVYFFGAKEEVVKKVVEKYQKQYYPELVAGYRNGYFTKDEEPAIAQQIADSKPNILFVAMTSPKQEYFINHYKDILKDVNFNMCVGGSFDVIAGKVKRAPLWMQNAGLEWFYRFLQEPRRMWKRYLVGNSQFIWMVFKEKFAAKK